SRVGSTPLDVPLEASCGSPCAIRVGWIVAGVVGMSASAGKPRARELGVPLEGEPGPLNAITDVPGVEVGHSTVVSGSSGSNEPVARTGVTAVLPRGKRSPTNAVFAGWSSQNGNGEMT